MPSVGGFCADCRNDFLRVAEPCCRCGLERSANGGLHRCPADAEAWAIDQLVAPFVYAPPLTRFLHALKYERQRSLGLALGELLRDAVLCGRHGPDVPAPGAGGPRATGGHGPAWDAVAFVPLHPLRLRQRGFNQADEIARPVARATGTPLLVSGIRRCADTPPQTVLGKRERLTGPRRAFVVSRNCAGLSLALVDDVVTTGATINALARALKQAGAVRVVGLAVLRSLGREQDAMRGRRAG
jgi:ComF family protein